MLGITPIGVRENFFDLRGHSLLAVRLFAQIEQASGRQLPLATLFQAPTVEQLTGMLRQEGWSAPWSCLVAIQPGSSKPPFFCIHSSGGHVGLSYYELARHLGSDHPLYGLQALGLDGQTAPLTRFEDMAAHYLTEIRSLQPEGPYFLGGRALVGPWRSKWPSNSTRRGSKWPSWSCLTRVPERMPHHGPLPHPPLLWVRT